MNKDFNSDYLRGHIDTIILKSLFDGEKYGYEICKDIETKSKGSFILKQPSLYSALKRLETSGLISSRWQDSEIGGKRHYYSLTEEGIKHYEATQAEWNYSYNILHNLLSDQNNVAEETQETTHTVESNDAAFIENAENGENLGTSLIDYNSENKQESQLNFFPENDNKDEQITDKNLEEIPQIEPENEEFHEPKEKNDAEFINETIIDEDNDVSFSNNVYFRVKNDLKKANETLQPVRQEKIEPQKIEQNQSKIATKHLPSFGEYEIKPYSKYNTQSRKTEFIKKNKFYFVLSAIIGLIMVMEFAAMLLAFKLCKITTTLTKPFMIAFIVAALSFPLFALANLIMNPHKKGIIRIKGQVLLKAVAFIILSAIVVGINLAVNLHCFVTAQAFTTIMIPEILLLNIIVEEGIYNILKNNVKFKA